MADKGNEASTRPQNFIRGAIDTDLAKNKFATRRWAGTPGDASAHAQAPLDPAAIRTRFPPEPNGYLHVGHAKSICLNFGLARDYQGRCHMRFDDTNPVKEDQEYVDSILDAVRWLGFNWVAPPEQGSRSELFYASDYFEAIYTFAQRLIQAGDAYVDSQTAEQMRATRGTLTEPGTNSPYRNRSVEENLALFAQMRAGQHPEGSQILRAKIDMASPNLNMRDPALYRIRFAHHHRTGDAWCIYPMYDFAHPISDALENITHSLCTLEFEDHRPFYDWVMAKGVAMCVLTAPVPQQIEFARLNLTQTITSKRKLQELVASGRVSGWDDPRMPTIVGLRRRGYTPEAIQLFCERIGVSKADSWIDMSVLEQALRDDLDPRSQRAIAVLDPLELVITNAPPDLVVPCSAPVHPHAPERGERSFVFTPKLWIEREDFAINPPKGFFRLFVGQRVRLRYGFVIECTGFEQDADGRIMRVLATYLEDSRSGTPGADTYKVKGAIHWLSQAGALPAQFRIYDRLFTDPHPDSGGKDYLASLNPQAMLVQQGFVEPGVAAVVESPEQKALALQFERHGYFVADRVDCSAQSLVFNRAVTLKDAWVKK
jgi:glutaminyl-tRNA synthetase